jgi:hypothetical protein
MTIPYSASAFRRLINFSLVSVYGSGTYTRRSGNPSVWPKGSARDPSPRAVLRRVSELAHG